ncbi:MAG: tetratricopeptide repeat protein [Spirochaetaceae bacterium]|jgi:predicted Zn-dependent protease|nr:tetratricopeptide repeat protein [Spirochaetaceae bacterium]
MKSQFIVLFFGAVAFFPLSAQERANAMDTYRTGRELEARGRIDEANNYYSAAVKLCTSEIDNGTATMDTYATLTWTLQRQKKYMDVIRWGQMALRIREDYRIIETMGEAYFYLNDFEASLRNMQRYAANLPQGDRTSVAYFFIGEIYRFQKKYHSADIAYTTAVQLEPGISLWWYRLGTVRESVRDFASAAEAFERALKINPSYNEAAEGLNRARKAAI